MRYDEERGKLHISGTEMVRIAKRGVSSTLPYDDEELSVDTPRERIRSKLLGDFTPQMIVFGFEASGYDFELSVMADKCEGGEITLVRSIPKGDRHPKKAQVDLTRAEAFISGYCCAVLGNLDRVTLRIFYIDEEEERFEETREMVTPKRLTAFFEKCKGSLLVYAKPEIERVTKRLPTLRTLKFPYKEIRRGQGEMVREVYRAIASSGSLIAEAPTGTGKTASVLFPALRALGDGRCDKVFYLTPKTTTAAAAKDCLELIAKGGGLVRALIITAKERVCLGEHACRGGRANCDYSKFNRLPDAVLELYGLEKTVITRDEVQNAARKFKVCPYELTLTYAELCDVVICDFNYLFDPGVYIKRFFNDGGNYAFLIDEAHNLPERAREMYSAAISLSELSEPTESIFLGDESPMRIAALECTETLYDILYPYVKEEIRENEKGEKAAAAHLSEVPYQIYGIFEGLERICSEELIRSYSAKDELASERTQYIKSYLVRVRRINTALSVFDEKYEMFIFLDKDMISFKLYCLDTGGVISSRLAKGASAVFFSATLTPLDYYRSLLGLDSSARVLTVGSPFDPSQLCVSVIDKISTRYSEREDTVGAICRTIAATVSARRGNYMIFSPSFAYSEILAKAFMAKYPKIKVLLQKPNMTAAQKREFLAEFESNSPSYLIGFCVMGGVYSEGVDLVGDKLIGAVVVGIGMPSLSYEREAISAYFDEKYEAGKQYAYIYPGMNRVLQAAGRVIRTENDRGVIVLIDDRFADPLYKKSAPDLWEGLKFIPDAKTLKEELEAFWKEVDGEKK